MRHCCSVQWEFNGGSRLPRSQLFTYLPRLRTGSMLMLWYVTINALVSAYAGILTPHTSITGAGRSARFVRTADVGGEAPGRSGASSRG
jgi:hypothetical protein